MLYIYSIVREYSDVADMMIKVFNAPVTSFFQCKHSAYVASFYTC